MILDTTHPSSAQIDALHAEWAKDAVVNRLEPSAELQKIPSLHAKYLLILSKHRRALQEGERKAAKLRRLKYEYYAGRLDKDTLDKYGWPPFPFTLKGDLATYMDADKDLSNANQVLHVHDEIVKVSESILKELGNRTYQLKDLIRWEMFILGTH
jgi:hypothetical protein